MADVFLSYARHDLSIAQRVARELSKHGWSVWFDQEISARETFADVIAVELNRARAVLVLWSPVSVESQWVRSEANHAREMQKLVQARLGDARLPMPFDQIHCASLGVRGARSRRGWTQVLQGLEELIASGGGSRAKRPLPLTMGRREALIGAGAAALAGGGLIYLRLKDRPDVSPQAQLLIDRGLAALQDNDALDPQGPGSTQQAIALLKDATDAAPDSATAWGGLSMAYAVRKRVAPLPERAGLDMRSRSAASRALALDDREPRALGALRLVDPLYRNWQTAEKANREALKKSPKLPILLFVLADMLGNVGRWKDAAAYSKQFDRNKFLIPGADRKVMIDLWCSGDLQAADAAYAMVAERWPQHPQVWQSRLEYLMYSGRPAEALQLLGTATERPLQVSRSFSESATATAAALAGRLPRADAIEANLECLAEDRTVPLQIAQACAALNGLRESFEILDGYYFGKGKWASTAPPAGDYDRSTGRLFQPPMRTLWPTPGFSDLLRRIGLESYWRESGTKPDFRLA